MTAPALIAALDAVGIALDVADDPAGPTLQYEGPAAALTPGVLNLIAQHKPALLAVLSPPGRAALSDGDDTDVVASGAPAWPPRPVELAGWPIPWRQRWADRAEAHQVEGLGWREAEQRAWHQTKAEFDAASGPGKPTDRTSGGRDR